ncbi:class I SAM-dependent methyltransferase [uncultured Tateyamaria sp.]|uniref:class I SAM-dependent methyltransferase n=1 Tax=Tateyamaria sp. 1078 TaxID=3417464 RepID=UPI00260C3202|nr:class I SAM-dependent methyltransferase [uncultured Tateyamaria sp.]
MTPEEWDAFLQVHHGLPREGPGAPADVQWAVQTIGLHGHVHVLDAGCGPGADMVTLAEGLPEAEITAIDKTGQFIELAQQRAAPFGPRVTAQVGDMAAPDGIYDLIWCAGALYFLGVTDGLRGWHGALNTGGRIAFSHPVLPRTPPSEAVMRFWEEYPEVTDPQGIEDQVTAAGYNVMAHRMIIGAPWQAYYDPMQVRIDTLRDQDTTAAVQAAIAESQTEIDRWRAASDEVAYALLIVAPV